MNVWDIILIIVIAVAVGAAVIHMIRNRKSGCGGCCSSCGESCPYSEKDDG